MYMYLYSTYSPLNGDMDIVCGRLYMVQDSVGIHVHVIILSIYVYLHVHVYRHVHVSLFFKCAVRCKIWAQSAELVERSV